MFTEPQRNAGYPPVAGGIEAGAQQWQSAKVGVGCPSQREAGVHHKGGRKPRRSGVKGESQEVMGDLIYLLVVAAFFALSIGYARIAPRL